MAGSERGNDPSQKLLKWVLVAVAAMATLTFVIAVAAVILLWPEDEEPVRPGDTTVNDPGSDARATSLGIESTESPPQFPTALPTPVPASTIPPLDWIQPTADTMAIAAALESPLVDITAENTIQRGLEPLTILPSRARSEVITYAVQPGDTLRTISEKFGLGQDTIIWSNDRFYVNAMRVGMELNILPVNGVYHRVGQGETIAELAAMYDVDPYAIIDSEYNPLFGTVPDTTLPEGLYVIVPGGTGSTEPIFWDPGIVMSSEGFTTDGSNPIGAGVKTGGVASFAVGDPGSCGEQIVSGGSLPVGAPIWRNYTITQDYSWNHGGIDLAVPEGTPVYAAGSGTVIFKGWSTWGYGYTVVIAHGSTLSIYGHLNGAFVGCGQIVSAGQNIAVTGSSGRSSGPHLHFEIRGSGGSPVSPWEYQSF
jgi:murein DD-endopeptidase MepM/ murein hydrolase activator NlpD